MGVGIQMVVLSIGIVVFCAVEDMLAERILCHQRQLQTVFQQRIAQGQVEAAIAVVFCQPVVFGEDVVITGIEQQGMTVVQKEVGRERQAFSPAIEVWIAGVPIVPTTFSSWMPRFAPCFSSTR